MSAGAVEWEGGGGRGENSGGARTCDRSPHSATNVSVNACIRIGGSTASSGANGASRPAAAAPPPPPWTLSSSSEALLSSAAGGSFSPPDSGADSASSGSAAGFADGESGTAVPVPEPSSSSTSSSSSETPVDAVVESLSIRQPVEEEATQNNCAELRQNRASNAPALRQNCAPKMKKRRTAA